MGRSVKRCVIKAAMELDYCNERAQFDYKARLRDCSKWQPITWPNRAEPGFVVPRRLRDSPLIFHDHFGGRQTIVAHF